MTTIELGVLVLGTATGLVTLALVLTLVKFNHLMLQMAERERDACGHLVTWGFQKESRCVLPIGHRSDHAVTLSSVEECGYNQSPF